MATTKATTIGPITLPDGTVVYMTTADNASITPGAGNFLVADFGQGGTITVGDGNSDVFALRGGATITTGTGDSIVVTGTKSTVTTGSNAGGTTDETLVSAGSGSTVNVGAGKNIVFMTGGKESVTTGTGTDVVYDLANGDNTVSLGNGTNWAFLHGCGNIVNDGTGTDTVWFGAGQSTLMPNAAGGSNFVYQFNNSDGIDVAAILGTSVPLTVAGLTPFVSLSEVSSAQFPGQMDSTVTIKGTGGTATMTLYGYDAGGLAAMVAHKVFVTARVDS